MVIGDNYTLYEQINKKILKFAHLKNQTPNQNKESKFCTISFMTTDGNVSMTIVYDRHRNPNI
jgi:hypothetical protein